jgi:hypothetical protein
MQKAQRTNVQPGFPPAHAQAPLLSTPMRSTPPPTLNLNFQRRIRIADIPETDAFPHPKRRQTFSNKGIPEQLRELSLVSQNTPVEVMTDPEPGFLLQCI